ncbi:MAG: hypothetical protein HY364_01970 [Candidatus Aenigmarchaeota archaeon]|nr:hypothetical protein [Candidatus Aenigmarchaeota archaeon]
MLIKKIQLQRHGYTFQPKEKELKRANKEMGRNCRNYYSPESETYTVEINLNPPMDAKLQIRSSINDVNRATGLNFDENVDHIRVTPYGLSYFTSPWTVQRSRNPHGQGVARIKFFANPQYPFAENINEYGINVHVPRRSPKDQVRVRNQEDYFGMMHKPYLTIEIPASWKPARELYERYNDHGLGEIECTYDYPEIVIDKFLPDITRETESEVADLYDNVCRLLRKSGAAGDAVSLLNEKTLSENLKAEGVDLRSVLASSTIRHRSPYVKLALGLNIHGIYLITNDDFWPYGPPNIFT